MNKVEKKSKIGANLRLLQDNKFMPMKNSDEICDKINSAMAKHRKELEYKLKMSWIEAGKIILD